MLEKAKILTFCDLPVPTYLDNVETNTLITSLFKHDPTNFNTPITSKRPKFGDALALIGSTSSTRNFLWI